MKHNYIDGKGVYHNELNLTLAQIYDSGVEFGCKVTAKDKAEDIIAELEKIKAEIKDYSKTLEFINHTTFVSEENTKRFIELEDVNKLIAKAILELKGEQE